MEKLQKVEDFKAMNRWWKTFPGFKDGACPQKAWIPVNQGNAHWYFLEVDFIQKKITVCDSMRGNLARYQGKLALLLNYLDEFLKTRAQQPSVASWTYEVDATYPQQKGCSDCGAFMLRGIHQRAVEASISLEQSQLRADILSFFAAQAV